MQIKKEELRQQILDAAQVEFLKKGYENSSLRVIAKKANTTLGNIYHYFPSKEALLIELCSPVLTMMASLAANHFDEEERIHSLEEIDLALMDMEQFWEEDNIKCILDQRLLIILDLKTTALAAEKDWFIQKFKDHIRWHLNLDKHDDSYASIIVHMFIDCIRHVLLEQQNPNQAKEEFIKVFRMLCTGIVSNDD